MTITEYIEKAIKKLEHTLISFDDRSFIIPGRIRQKVQALYNWDLNRLNKNFISLARRHEPDFCLITGGHRILPETIKKIKKQGIQTGLWTIDLPSDFQPIINAAPYYDFVFCGGTEAQEPLAKAGIKKTHWIPFACDPEFHKPVKATFEEKEKWSSDIAFIGSYYPNRGQVLEKISDFNINVWGPGWDKLPYESPLRTLAKNIKLKPKKWIKILSSSKIIMAIHYQDGKTPCYQASPKVYETMACKSFLLVDDQKDVKSLFLDGKHLVIFKDIKDLREKIVYYINHPEEREKIAEEGYEEVLQKHTYQCRLEKIISIIRPRKNENH